MFENSRHSYKSLALTGELLPLKQISHGQPGKEGQTARDFPWCFAQVGGVTVTA